MHSLQKTFWDNISQDDLKSHLKDKYYRLTEWPNFGFSRYSPDFIVLSANLTKKFMNKKQLVELIDSREQIVNHFLNAAYMLQIIEVSDSIHHQNIQREPASNFIVKLKSLFGF